MVARGYSNHRSGSLCRCSCRRSILDNLHRVVIPLLFLPFAAHSEAFPGDPGGPRFRFDNGAVGSVQAVGGGSADVQYYDGSSVLEGPFPISLDSSAVIDNSNRVLAGTISDMADGVISISDGNVCYDHNSEITTDARRLTLCQITLLDACDFAPRTHNNVDNQKFIIDVNAPCWHDSYSVGSVVSIVTLGPWESGTYSHCLYGDSACERYMFDDLRTEYYIDPDLFDSSTTREADINDYIDGCLSSQSAGPYTGSCEALQSSLSSNLASPVEIVTGSGAASINTPVAAPSGLTGSSMNPSGYQSGGSGGSATDFVDGSGTTDPGAGGSGGSGGTDTGTGDDETGLEDATVNVDGLDDSFELPTREVAIPGISSGSSWLPAGCPSPIEISIPQVGALPLIDFQPLCDIAPMIKALILASAALTALMIATGSGTKNT